MGWKVESGRGTPSAPTSCRLQACQSIHTFETNWPLAGPTHPLYITTSIIGGGSLNDNQGETVFAGGEFSAGGWRESGGWLNKHASSICGIVLEACHSFASMHSSCGIQLFFVKLMQSYIDKLVATALQAPLKTPLCWSGLLTRTRPTLFITSVTCTRSWAGRSKSATRLWEDCRQAL